MGLIYPSNFAILSLLVLLSSVHAISGSRKLASVYNPPPNLLTYHNGALLQGDIPISIIWYGNFSPVQKSIISDFLLSLTTKSTDQVSNSITAPSVSKWWSTVETLIQKAGKEKTHISLANQISDEHCSIGKRLARTQLSQIALRANPSKTGIALVLTADDVAVEGFCMSSCGTHDSVTETDSPYIWVGNSATQCPGQCAWPFHQPQYGPQNQPLVAPNSDIGMDGMVINIAKLLAGAVTNPFRDGYFQGDAGAPVEVGSACPGMYGQGAYPGYTGELLVDSSTGASYNVDGVNGRKYLVPVLFDASTSSCSPVV